MLLIVYFRLVGNLQFITTVGFYSPSLDRLVTMDGDESLGSLVDSSIPIKTHVWCVCPWWMGGVVLVLLGSDDIKTLWYIWDRLCPRPPHILRERFSTWTSMVPWRLFSIHIYLNYVHHCDQMSALCPSGKSKLTIQVVMCCSSCWAILELFGFLQCLSTLPCTGPQRRKVTLILLLKLHKCTMLHPNKLKVHFLRPDRS